MSTIKRTSLADSIAALQAAADDVVAKVPGTPRVVVTINRQNSDRRRKRATYGYTTTAKVWHEEDGERYLEVALAAEHLNRPHAEVFGTLLHELAHAYNLNNDIKDVDVNGRHNKRFAATATDLFGLIIEEAPGIGWSKTTCPDETVKRFTKAFTFTAKATRFTAAAPTSVGTAGPAKRNTNNPVASCDCGNKVRAAATTIAKLRCDDCDSGFTILS